MTADSKEAELAKLIAIILNVAAATHHIFQVAFITSASIDERLEHELEINSRNNEKERRRKRPRYWRKRASVFASFHI